MTSSLSNTLSSEDRPVTVLWGCELNSGIRSCVVKEEDDLLEHLVYLKTMSLGEGATDELHVVAAESKNMASAPKPVPIASLRHSILPMVSLDGFEFIPPVTFILKSGSGPVYLNGQHLILEDLSDYDTAEDTYQPPPEDDSGAYSNGAENPNDPGDLEEDSQGSQALPPEVMSPEAVPPELPQSEELFKQK
ncbi:nucleoplasmin-like [Tiliqua scincoides]|uniref:nucleoplasmin-like n=1 Tax=Tiliqua scincoides TaxID=71010 RepID=UPI003461C926